MSDAIADFAQGKSIVLPPGVFHLTDTLRFVAHGQSLAGSGPATILRCTGNFQEAIVADQLRSCVIRDLTLDVNAPNRPELTTRALGVVVTLCTAAEIRNVVVTGTVGGPAALGGGAVPGVGIVLGMGERCLIDGCTLIDCGLSAPGKTSDGVYAAGVGHTIRNSKAIRVTDTGFVLEQCDYSSILDCTIDDSPAGIAITNIGTQARFGNFAERVTITNWAAQTGAVALGTLGNAAGDLIDTRLSNITIRGTCSGPAVNCRRVGVGMARGLALKGVSIAGAGTQGILVMADDVSIQGCSISGTGWTAVQVEPGSRNVRILGNALAKPKGGWGVTVNAVAGPASDGLVRGNTFTGFMPLEAPVYLAGHPAGWLVDSLTLTSK